MHTTIALDEHVQQYDTGPTVAVYSASAANPFFPDYIRATLLVRVECQIGRRPLRWMASVDLSLPDADRTWWGERVVCATLDAAAEEAAAMLCAARPLFEASVCGEVVETPGRRRGLAAEASADALPEYRAAIRRASMLRGARRDLPADSDEHPAAHRRYLDARSEAESLRRRAIDAFRDAHGWREFRVTRRAGASTKNSRDRC